MATDVITAVTTANRALATALSLLNFDGGSRQRINDAIAIVNQTKTVQQLLHQASVSSPKYRSDYHMDDGLSSLGKLPAPLRLALEMSLHEKDEQRAMNGELRELEARWKQADEVAKISDSLLLPQTVQQQLDLMKGSERR